MKLRVINIRGTNGSGKTSLVRSLMSADEPVDVVIGPHETPGHWLPNQRIVIVGPYPEGKATGGMDNVRTTQEALDAVKAAAQGDFRGKQECAPFDGQVIHAVVFEGILISTVFKTWLDFSRELKTWHSEGLIWAFMSTPLETAIERVKQRRAAKGRPTEGFKEDQVADKFKSIAGNRQKATDAGEIVLDLGEKPEKTLRYFLGYSGA